MTSSSVFNVLDIIFNLLRTLKVIMENEELPGKYSIMKRIRLWREMKRKKNPMPSVSVCGGCSTVPPGRGRPRMSHLWLWLWLALCLSCGTAHGRKKIDVFVAGFFPVSSLIQCTMHYISIDNGERNILLFTNYIITQANY